jgi:hypothetical protein
MRTRTGWLASLLIAAGVALAPTTARAQVQDYEVPLAEPAWPLPLYHDRPEKGGFYAATEFILWRQDNPLKHEVVAIRGFIDFTGGATNLPGTFHGSGNAALYADDVGGPLTYQPGFDITLGWRFEGGLAVDVTWYYLAEAKYAATASLIPPNFNLGFQQADSFLFSPVFGFPTDFAGPNEKIVGDFSNALFGIWNGATQMSIEFDQRFQQYDGTARIPIFEDDSYRCYALVGPRFSWIWERFRWRTVSLNAFGQGGQDDVAIYNNIVSNRMYGVHCGAGTEWVICNTPAGTFSWSLDLQGALLIDIAKERAKYERGDFETSSHRSKTEYTFVPEAQGQVNLWWYPIEGVQLRVGYNVMDFFNTIAAPYPVSFNYGGLDPPWQHQFSRFFDGLNAGIALIF